MAPTVEERVSALEKRVDALERGRPGTPPRTGTGGDAPSPAEFLISHPGARSNRDIALVAAYYLREFEGAREFDHDGLTTFFGGAKVPVPKNRRDLTYRNVRAGFFREVGPRVQSSRARNKWSLTPSGSSRVERYLVSEKHDHDGGR